MKRLLNYTLAIVGFLTASCRERPPNMVADEHLRVLNELIVLRTEGLALAEVAASASHDEQVNRTIGHIKTYYTHTHPEFLKLCEGQIVVLAQKDFATIWTAVEHQLLRDAECTEKAFLSLYIANTARSIVAYERVLRGDADGDVYLFALRALPGLYSQRSEIASLLRQHAYRDSAHQSVSAKWHPAVSPPASQ